MRSKRAFTLIEVLMVVIIMGIASAMIVPQISERDDLKVTSAARALMADLMYAQNVAIAKQSRQYVAFFPSNKQYWVVNAWPDTIATHPVSGAAYIVNFGSAVASGVQGVSLVSADFDGQSALAFDALGTPLAVAGDGTTTTMGAGTIVLSRGNFSLTITVHPYTGELTVQ